MAIGVGVVGAAAGGAYMMSQANPGAMGDGIIAMGVAGDNIGGGIGSLAGGIGDAAGGAGNVLGGGAEFLGGGAADSIIGIADSAGKVLGSIFR